MGSCCSPLEDATGFEVRPRRRQLPGRGTGRGLNVQLRHHACKSVAGNCARRAVGSTVGVPATHLTTLSHRLGTVTVGKRRRLPNGGERPRHAKGIHWHAPVPHPSPSTTAPQHHRHTHKHTHTCSPLGAAIHGHAQACSPLVQPASIKMRSGARRGRRCGCLRCLGLLFGLFGLFVTRGLFGRGLGDCVRGAKVQPLTTRQVACCAGATSRAQRATRQSPHLWASSVSDPDSSLLRLRWSRTGLGVRTESPPLKPSCPQQYSRNANMLSLRHLLALLKRPQLPQPCGGTLWPLDRDAVCVCGGGLGRGAGLCGAKSSL